MGTLTALRTAVRLRLVSDAALVALLGGPNVFHRFVRTGVQVPSVTYYDSTFYPSNLPRLDSSFMVDVWARDLDAAEAIAARVVTLLDQGEAAFAGLAPLTAPGGEVALAVLSVMESRDTLDVDPTIVRKTLRFALVSFALQGA